MKRILVFDNGEVARGLFESILIDEGWEVFSYEYTDIDFAAVQQLGPDLIIFDLDTVPDGAGWSLLQLLKMEDVSAVIPVLICTAAENLVLEIKGYLATRHISIIHKPLDIPAFLVTIRKILVADVVLPILLVEDNEDLSATIMTILELEGYLVMTACNGQLALEAVAQARYALILLDLSMPVMSGFEFLAVYARQLETHSPVIILSAKADLITTSLPAFVVNVLPKPFEISHLLAVVSGYVRPLLWKAAI